MRRGQTQYGAVSVGGDDERTVRSRGEARESEGDRPLAEAAFAAMIADRTGRTADDLAVPMEAGTEPAS
ncbi:hypothetical protein [Streptomyces sp. NPDC088812]|uniref:hypothetical protein n=1 Tax=Streptomyces sp. NPDC088812 TaxID=3365905 RepID=UPI0038272C0B